MMRRLRSMLLSAGMQCFLAGLLTPLAFAPTGWWPVQIVTLAWLLWSLQGVTAHRAFRLGWLFGMGSFVVGISWVFVSMYWYGNAPAALAVLLVIVLSAYLALFPALSAWALLRWFPERLWLLAFPALWALTELARGYALTGFPWLASGYSQIDGPLAGLAPIVGVYGLGLAIAFCAVALAMAGAKRWLGLPLMFALMLGGGWLKSVPWTYPSGSMVEVALLQGNVSQDLKWRPDWLRPTLERYKTMSHGAFGADLIVWPEVAVPASWGQVRDADLLPLAYAARKHDSTIVTGLLTRREDGPGHYNTVVALTEVPQFYRKRHLVPFGEYFPVPDFVRRWLFELNMPSTDAVVGADQQAPLMINGLHVGVSICFEDVFGEELVAGDDLADIHINVTNDAWFGNSLAPHQHLEISRMRALETGRFWLRAANTGISAVIDPKGNVLARTEQFETQVLRGSAKAMNGITPFAKYGNALVFWFAVILLVFGLTLRKRFA